MKIAVLGAGAGGTAIAFDCAYHGHEVRLFDFPQFPENITAIDTRVRGFRGALVSLSANCQPIFTF